MINGGFGRGVAPGFGDGRDLASANGRSFSGEDVTAIYQIVGQGGTDRSMRTSNGANFMWRLASPDDAGRGLTREQISNGRMGALGIHPDGDSADTFGSIPQNSRVTYDGSENDGTNGCFGVVSGDASRFQQAMSELPENQKPTELLVLKGAPNSLSSNQPSSYGFQNVPNLKQDSVVAIP